MGNKKRSNSQQDFKGEAWEKGLNIQDVHKTWDATVSIRTRIRDGGGVMHEKSGLSCDNYVCGLNSEIVLPILSGMSGSAERKLPSIADIRSEMAILYEINKRTGPEIVDKIQAEAMHVRKLLSFIKAKVRRQEVSLALGPQYHPFLLFLCWLGA